MSTANTLPALPPCPVGPKGRHGINVAWQRDTEWVTFWCVMCGAIRRVVKDGPLMVDALDDAPRDAESMLHQRRIEENLRLQAELRERSVQVIERGDSLLFELTDGRLLAVHNAQRLGESIVRFQALVPVSREDAEDLYGWTSDHTSGDAA